MSSIAQEESRNISENVTWGQRKSFSDGKVKLPYKQFLGYRKGADGTPEIVPEEAEIILRIYSDFISGKSASAIAKELTREGVPTPAKKAEWHKRTVESILTNEKYKGAALLQKRYTVDFLQKKMKVNEGEVSQYYVEESHPAIIGAEAFSGCTRLTKVTIPETVTEIGTMAFAFCPLIERVYYFGTEDDWNKIKIGAYNDFLISAERVKTLTENR